MNRSWHNVAYYGFRTAEYVFGTVATVFAIVLLLEPSNWVVLGRAIKFMQEWKVVVAAASGGSVAAKFAADKIGPRWIHEFLQSIVDALREGSFSKTAIANKAVHYHRVTVFRHCCCWRPSCWGDKINGKRRWPWTGWLVPIARSGHTTKSTSVLFLAPDDADNAQGIAGQTWSQKQIVDSGPLPLIADDADDETIEAYAEGSYVSPHWIKERLEKKQPLPRYLYGIPLESQGKMWGVVVLDSRDDDAIKATRVSKAFRTLGKVLGAIAPRVAR